MPFLNREGSRRKRRRFHRQLAHPLRDLIEEVDGTRAVIDAFRHLEPHRRHVVDTESRIELA